jgi:hypothetical protein
MLKDCGRVYNKIGYVKAPMLLINLQRSLQSSFKLQKSGDPESAWSVSLLRGPAVLYGGIALLFLITSQFFIKCVTTFAILYFGVSRYAYHASHYASPTFHLVLA